MPFNRELHLEWRGALTGRIRAEIVGPDPQGTPITPDAAGVFQFDGWSVFEQPSTQANGQEILKLDPPGIRYGAGVLYPPPTQNPALAEPTLTVEDVPLVAPPEPVAAGAAAPVLQREQQALEKFRDDVSSERRLDFSDGAAEAEAAITMANSWRPSAMGLTLHSALPDTIGQLVARIRWGVYHTAAAQVAGGNQRTMWLRAQREMTLNLDPGSIREQRTEWPLDNSPLKLQINPRRAIGNTSGRVYTFALVHTGNPAEPVYQTELQLSATNAGIGWILPYPEPERTQPEPDEEELRLQYRKHQTFAIGHGCTAQWTQSGTNTCSEVRTEMMPVVELPHVSADALDMNGQPVAVSMDAMADLDFGQPKNEGVRQLDALVGAYEAWIAHEEARVDQQALTIDNQGVDQGLLDAADRVLGRLRGCLARMRDGIKCLQGNDNALRAFQLANAAALLAWRHGSRQVRTPTSNSGNLTFPAQLPNKADGSWRSFQIAFLLMSVRGICEPGHQDRDIVDLIWFPTGGGKTEAYLALVAFTTFHNRLSGIARSGVEVIMRYTLRLLTTQQTERALLLICAMETLRADHHLGESRFGLGMWVGGTTTPNNHAAAVTALGALNAHPQNADHNQFGVLKCPWCHAAMGPVRVALGNGNANWRVLGYGQVGSGASARVVMRCPDPVCRFSEFGDLRSLPIEVVDEGIYGNPPTLLIATADKFAQIPFQPAIRSIFGLDPNGGRLANRRGPSLVIQDELHLISGPLGSVYGHFETMIDALCHSTVDGRTVRPKIVASTATIRRARDQVRALYARPMTHLFPPPGLDKSDSFFGREMQDRPGRCYLGVMASNHGSMQTTLARVYGTILEGVGRFDNANPAQKDPWWTLLLFFNSLRELGGASAVLASDTVDHLKTLTKRWGGTRTRYLDRIVELTSRIASGEVAGNLKDLEREHTAAIRAVDVCLATNIIEVGVDIDRLSLMAITGQPKTTAQYIQVSGRVGRRVHERPGLVLMIYHASKPRDRSHYERFQAYHERLYAQVEPTSVTPFSPPAVSRLLHSLLVGWLRMRGAEAGIANDPTKVREDATIALLDALKTLIDDRARLVDAAEQGLVSQHLLYLIERWQALPPPVYGGYTPPNQMPLIVPAGQKPNPLWSPEPWSTMTSMRNVDASCEGEITTFYARHVANQIQGNN